MKEEKIYMSELPESCIDCPCCSCDLKPEFIKIGDFMYCNLLRQKFRFKEERKKLKDCPLINIKTYDREKDKRIKELEQKVQELQEVDNKRAFRLYCVLYDILEEQYPKDVASRIDYLTGKDYSEMCEMYKTAKNIKQHDRALVKEVCEKIKEQLGFIVDGQERIVCDGSATGDKTILAVLNQIQKEFEK